jgi:hypothetical protein
MSLLLFTNVEIFQVLLALCTVQIGMARYVLFFTLFIYQKHNFAVNAYSLYLHRGHLTMLVTITYQGILIFLY